MPVSDAAADDDDGGYGNGYIESERDYGLKTRVILYFLQQEFSARKTLSLKEKEEGGYWLITLPYGVTAAIETDIEANVLRIRMGWFSQYLTRKNDKKITGDLGDVRSEIVRTYDVDSGVLLNVTLRNEIRGDWKGGRM